MVFRVDFHIRDDHGRVVAFAREAVGDLPGPGDRVLAEDDEGNRCKALVEAISPGGQEYYLALIPGTSEPSEHARWVVEAGRAEDEESSDYERFERLATSLISVPKDEIERS